MLQTGLLGPALAPLIGGLAATYSSWRMMQWILFGMSIVALVLVFAVIPETKHPGSRGIDVFREQEAKSGRNRQWTWVWLNPFKSLLLLRGPNVLLVVRI
jgi:MFS family permease